LHQPELLSPASGLRIKPAFAPDDGFDERWFDPIFLRGLADDAILAVLQ